jgi:hypothetical protein
MSHPLERETAEMVAARLTRWQIIDLVYIHRNGRMEIGRRPNGETRAPVQRLIDDNILSMGGSGQYVLPGPRFKAVVYALARMGQIQSLETSSA